MDELARMVDAGHRAAVLYLVQRNDVDRFAVAGDIDPEYAKQFSLACDAGVEVYCYGTNLSPCGISLGKRIA